MSSEKHLYPRTNLFAPKDYHELKGNPEASPPGTYALDVREDGQTILLRVGSNTFKALQESSRLDLCWANMPYYVTTGYFALGVKGDAGVAILFLSDRNGHKYSTHRKIHEGADASLQVISDRPHDTATMGNISAQTLHWMFLHRSPLRHSSMKVDDALDRAELLDMLEHYNQVQRYEFWSWRRGIERLR